MLQLERLLEYHHSDEFWDQMNVQQLTNLSRNFHQLRTNQIKGTEHQVDEPLSHLQTLIRRASATAQLHSAHRRLSDFIHSPEGAALTRPLTFEFHEKKPQWLATDPLFGMRVEIQLTHDGRYQVDALDEPFEEPEEAVRYVLQLIHPNYPEMLREVHDHPLFCLNKEQTILPIRIQPSPALTLDHFYLITEVGEHLYPNDPLPFRITKDNRYRFGKSDAMVFDTLEDALAELAPGYESLLELIDHPNVVDQHQVNNTPLPAEQEGELSEVEIYWAGPTGFCVIRAVDQVYHAQIRLRLEGGFGLQFGGRGTITIATDLDDCVAKMKRFTVVADLLRTEPDVVRESLRWFRFLVDEGLLEAPQPLINPETGSIWVAPVSLGSIGAHDDPDQLYSDRWIDQGASPAWPLLCYMIAELANAPSRDAFIKSAQSTTFTRDDAGPLLPLLEWLEHRELEDLELAPNERLFDGRRSFPDRALLPSLSPASKGIVYEAGGSLRHHHDPVSHWEYIYLQILAFRAVSLNHRVYRGMNNGRHYMENPGAKYLQGLAGFPCHPANGGAAPMIEELEQLLIRAFNRADEKGELDAFWHTCFSTANVCLEARLRQLTTYIGQEDDLFVVDLPAEPDLYRDLGEILRVFRHVEFQRYAEQAGHSFWDYNERERRDLFDHCPVWEAEHFTFENIWGYLMESEEFMRRDHLKAEGTEKEKRVAKARLHEAINLLTDLRPQSRIVGLDLATPPEEPGGRPLLAHLDLAGS